ncbi:MAG: hypothetical protein JWN04_4699, partial [Myxococcaceae bacterium]|nr:hypothetical protein [Myxococcaceae bacterium]
MALRSWSIALLCLTLPGCMSGYAAPAPVAPLLTGKGDVVVGANVRPAYPRREASVSVAAAPTESTRVYVAGSRTNARWDDVGDNLGRGLKEGNRTTEAEAGGGWGMALTHLRVEVLGAVGYGKAQTTQCGKRDWLENYDSCPVLVQAQGHFVRTSVQAQAPAHFARWTGGGGARIALVQFHYDQVLGQAGPLTASIPTLEPFIVQRLELPYGSLQLMIHIPIVPYSPSVSLSGAEPSPSHASTRLIETPWPRFFVGFQANIDELWRK